MGQSASLATPAESLETASPRKRRSKGLSCVRGNFHAQFLEGWTGAIPSGYSVILQWLKFAVKIPPERQCSLPGPLLLVARTHHASSSGRIGSRRMRFLVAAKIALQTAGAIGGMPGSPIPLEG